MANTQPSTNLQAPAPAPALRSPADILGWVLILVTIAGGFVVAQGYRGRADASILTTMLLVPSVAAIGIVMAIDARKRATNAGAGLSWGLLGLVICLPIIGIIYYLIYMWQRDKQGMPRKFPFAVASMLVFMGGFAFATALWHYRINAECEVIASGDDVSCTFTNKGFGPAHGTFAFFVPADRRVLLNGPDALRYMPADMAARPSLLMSVNIWDLGLLSSKVVKVVKDENSGRSYSDPTLPDKVRRVCKPGDRFASDKPGCLITRVIMPGETMF